MSDLMATRGASCVDRSGISTVSGTVSQFQDTNVSVTVTNTNGTTNQIATKATANMAFNDGDKELPNDSETAQSVTINGSFIFLVRDNVKPDHDITDGGSNSSIQYSPA
jgi:hypothetical protein